MSMKPGDGFAYVWGSDKHLCWSIVDHIDDEGEVRMHWVRPVWVKDRGQWTRYSRPVRVPGIIVRCNADEVLADFTAAQLLGEIDSW